MSRTSDRLGVFSCLLALIVVKVVLQLHLYQIGFVSVSADEHSRGIRAAAWLAGDDPLPLYDGAWLPFEFYLNAAALSWWDEVFWAPRLTAFLSSCLLLIFYFLLVHELFARLSIAFIASLMLLAYPWYAWLSGTPMLDIYYLAFFVAGLYFLLRWFRRRQGSLLALSSFFFILSTGFHSQSWILVNTANFIVGMMALSLLYRRSFKEAAALFCYIVANNAFIALYLVVEFVETGRALAFFAEHASYSKWVRQGYEVAAWRKLFYYPVLVIRSAPVPLLLLPVSLYALWRAEDRPITLVPLLLGALSGLLFSIFNVLSVPATAAPGRYALPFFILLAPYMAHGLVVLLGPGSRIAARWHWRPALAPLALATVALILTYAWRLEQFPRGARPESLEAGRHLRALIEQSDWRPHDSYMLEVDYWEFLPLELTARHYDSAVLDRDADAMNRDVPSILVARTSEEIRTYLRARGTRLIAARSDEVKAALDRLDFVEPQATIGDWTIYRTLGG